MSQLVQKTEQVLADTYALYLKTQNYHWNVRSVNFNELHALFGAQYEALGMAIDEIAEAIRSLNVPVKADLMHFSQLSSIKHPSYSYSAQHMISDLAESHEVVFKTVTEAALAARDANDLVIEDLMIARLSWHRKTIWMLLSHLQ